jgi:hypothetical protein
MLFLFLLCYLGILTCHIMLSVVMPLWRGSCLPAVMYTSMQLACSHCIHSRLESHQSIRKMIRSCTASVRHLVACILAYKSHNVRLLLNPTCYLPHLKP